jgi:hypothetical protein
MSQSSQSSTRVSKSLSRGSQHMFLGSAEPMLRNSVCISVNNTETEQRLGNTFEQETRKKMQRLSNPFETELSNNTQQQRLSNPFEDEEKMTQSLSFVVGQKSRNPFENDWTENETRLSNPIESNSAEMNNPFLSSARLRKPFIQKTEIEIHPFVPPPRNDSAILLSNNGIYSDISTSTR